MIVLAALLAAVFLAAGCSVSPHVSTEERVPISAVPLRGTEPSTSGDDDLKALADGLDGARIVGLGESVHGTHELHRLAHRIFAYLAEHEGFTVFALEVDQAHAVLLNEYVLGSREDLDAILDESWWASAIFYDEALRELLLWMRDYNESTSQPLHFAGYDLKQPDLAIRALLGALREQDRAAAIEVEQRYAEIARLGGFGGVPSFLGYSATLPLSLPQGNAAPHRLSVALRVRASGLSRGTVGLTLRGGDAAPVTTTLRASDLSAGDPWVPLEASLAVPAGTTNATLLLFHRGNGTVWFDGLGATVDGQPLPEIPNVSEAAPLPLQMPHLQVMDYSAAVESALRVESDPRLDIALAAAERISAIVDEHLRQQASVSPARSVWLHQLARLVEQATEWRTLAQLNRDVLLAENLTWLARDAYPGARILALGHTSHTERLPQRMGSYLAERHGEAYRTVSMLLLEGQSRDFGSVATLRPRDPLQLVRFTAAQASPLARSLAQLGRGDLVVALTGASPDLAILIRSAGPVRPRSGSRAILPP